MVFRLVKFEALAPIARVPKLLRVYWILGPRGAYSRAASYTGMFALDERLVN